MKTKTAPGDRTDIWTTEVSPGKWRARCKLRLMSGREVPVMRDRATKAKAETAIKRACRERLALEDVESLVANDRTLGEVLTDWLAEFNEDAARADSTKQTYNYVAGKMVGTPFFERIPSEITPADAEDWLNGISKNPKRGYGAAKTSRAIVKQVMDRAVREELIKRNVFNGLPDIKRYSGKKNAVERDHDMAFEPEQIGALLLTVYTNARTQSPTWEGRQDGDPRGWDLADLMFFMTYTGVRIGEALAVTWSKVRLDAVDRDGDPDPHVVIDGTINRITGVGLVRGDTKTKESTRVIQLADRLVEVLEKRLASAENPDGPVFPAIGRWASSPRGGWKDPSNVDDDMRYVFDEMDLGLEWATSHTFRRTLITLLGDDPELPFRMVSDLAGHVNTDFTKKVYTGRKGKDPRGQVRAAINRLP